MYKVLIVFSGLLSISCLHGEPVLSEDEIAKELKKQFHDVMTARPVVEADGKTWYRRPVFSKAHGCLKAKFIVNKDLPQKYRKGAFKRDWYPAWIRFSNDSSYGPDKAEVARGMAIKVIGVGGKKLLRGQEEARTQDFVMENYPIFFARDAAQFLAFTTAALSKDRTAFPEFKKKNKDLTDILDAMGKVLLADPLDGTYWTPTPYRFGRNEVKYRARPCVDVAYPPTKKMEGEHFIRDNLREHLKQKEPICMKFEMQFRTDPLNMPIDNAQVKWSEAGEGKFREFAELKIYPGQDIDSDEAKERCENFSMTGWHTNKRMEPLGSINVARGKVYEYLAEERRNFNKVQSLKEPESLILPDEDKL